MKLICICTFMLFYFYEVQSINHSLFMKNYYFEPKISKIFSKLLVRYWQFTIVFHTENRTIQFVEVIMRYFMYNTTTTQGPTLITYLVYNHDVLTSDQQFCRPNATKIVNFLFTSQWKLWKALAVPEKINSNDVVIFVAVGNGTVQKTVDRKGLEFVKLAGKVLLLEIIRHHGVTFYETCYYCGENSMTYKFVEKTHNSKLNTPLETFMPSLFKDLNGHKFIIVFIPYFPYIVCKQTRIKFIGGVKTQICENIEGIENEMLKTISQKINFTYEVHIMNENATFMNMIEYINELKADIAIGGISMTVNRIPLVQFSNQYTLEELTFLYKFKIELREVFLKFFEPFEIASVWILYFIVMFTLSTLIYLSLNFNKSRKFQISYFNSFWIMFRTAFDQASPYISRIQIQKYSSVIILALWWWCCLIINTVYRSMVLSTVVNPPSLEPDNLEQLLHAGYKFVANAQFEDIITDLMDIPDPLYREAYSKISYGPETCDVFNKILQGNVAMLDEISSIQFEIRELCAEPYEEIKKWLRIGRKSLRTTGHAWAIQRGAPYRTAINFYINLILNGGHFKRWTNDVTMNYQKNMIPKSREASNKKFRRLTLKRFFPLLTIYLIGTAISINAFICEFIYYRALQ